MTTNYVQLPPDGVGKLVRHRKLTDLVINTTGYAGNVPVVGSTITGSVTGAYGNLAGVFNSTTINYYLTDVVGTFTTADYVRTGATYYGAVTEIVANVYTPGTIITDPKVPEYAVTVEKASGGRGAALVQFPEFAPQFDAFGHMQVSQMQPVGEYYHFAYDLPGKYWTYTAGSGTVVHNPQISAMVYSTGTSAADVARRSTGQYHPYKPGVSQLILTSCSCGDTGVANVIREWGYFDDNNGFGFRLDGTTWKVFLRSDASGVPIDIEVSQANWNVNTLLTDATSDMIGALGGKVLDASKNNIYWMDVQGTAGRVRLGVTTPDGRRITVHQFLWSNTYPDLTKTNVGAKFAGNGTVYGGSIGWATVCRQLSLPITWQQRNTGSAAGTTYLRVGVGVVFSETADIKYTGVYTHITPPNPITVTSSDDYQPFLSFKAKSTINGPSISATAGISGSPGLITGANYTIETVGTTNFTLVGAGSNNPGVVFTATGTASGTGTVHQNVQNSVIGIHETFDWATTGNVNLHIGIFVAPSDDYLQGRVWSETIDPNTMLYVDQTAYAMPNYQFWGTSAQITANISPGLTIQYEGVPSYATGNLWVSGITSGPLLKEMYISQNQFFANAAWTTGSVTNKSKIIKQLTSTETPNLTTANTAYVPVAVGGRSFSVTSTTGLNVGQLISGTGVPMGTIVDSITGNVVLMNGYFTSIPSGPVNYNFSNVGYRGNYQVTKSQTLSTINMYGYYRFQPIESFIAPANSEGRTALGDRIDKSFGLGPNLTAPENAKGVFIFGVKALGNVYPGSYPTLMFTKFWKEIR